MVTYRLFQLLFISIFFSLSLSAECRNGSCSRANAQQGNEDYANVDEEPQVPCVYYFYEADVVDQWIESPASWPGKREDAWYDQFTR